MLYLVITVYLDQIFTQNNKSIRKRVDLIEYDIDFKPLDVDAYLL